MPYTAMYVSAMGMGFTTNDLDSMPFSRLMLFFHEYNSMHDTNQTTGERVIRGSSRDLANMI